MNFGYEGLGLFYTILEKLAGQEKPIKTDVLKAQLKVGKRLNKCWKFMESLDIISSNNGETFNKQLLNNSEKFLIKKEKNRKRIANWREKQGNVTCNKPVTNKIVTPSNISKDNISKDNILSEQSSPVKYSIKDKELSCLLIDLIRDNTPTFKEPNVDKWAGVIEKMHRIDKRTYEQIEFVIRWAQKSDFWCANILSTSKLRAKFDTLVAQIKRDKTKGITTQDNKIKFVG